VLCFHMILIKPFSIGKSVIREAEDKDADVIHFLVRELYSEDQKIAIDEGHITRTLAALKGLPEKGCVVVFENDNSIIGYTILIPFWSNEYGGNILNIDEIFLLPAFRGKGLGTEVIRSLIQQRPYHAVAVQLETTPDNSRAKRLYEKIGFKTYENQQLIFEYE